MDAVHFEGVTDLKRVKKRVREEVDDIKATHQSIVFIFCVCLKV